MSSRTLRFLVLLLPLLVAGATAGTATGTTNGTTAAKFPTLAESLELAFPEARVEKERVLLDKRQRKAIEKRSGCKLETSILFRYEAFRDGACIGTAYLDGHKVRTKRETLLIVLDAKSHVRRIELLAFAEPPEYLPRAEWYGQFRGKGLTDKLELKRGIRGISGATLTARATVRAVRRTLAAHEVLKSADTLTASR